MRHGERLFLAALAIAACGGGGGQARIDAGMDAAAAPIEAAAPDMVAPEVRRDPDTSVAPDAPVRDAGADRTADVAPPSDAQPASAFVVSGRITYPNASGAALPSAHDFTLRLDGATAILGAEGTAARVMVRSSDGRSFEATAPFDARARFEPACGRAATLRYRSFTFTRTSAGLTGAGAGRVELVSGDRIFNADFTVTLEGRPGEVAPSFGFDRLDLDPLAGLFLAASDPLPARATARLASPAGSLVLTPYLPPKQIVPDGGVPTTEDVGVVAGFHKPAAVALAYEAEYRLEVTPATGLGGQPVASVPRLATLPSPPVVREDGFESVTTADVGGGALIEGQLPPITGARSLFVADRIEASVVLGRSAPRFTARLTVQAGDRVVRASVRPVSSSQQSIPSPVVLRAAVPGGAIETSPALPALGTNPSQHRAAGGFVWLGAVHTVEVPVPKGAAGEIVVDLRIALPEGACGNDSPPPGYLIDDLRAE